MLGFHAENRKEHLFFFVFFFLLIGENQCGRITRNTEKNLSGLRIDKAVNSTERASHENTNCQKLSVKYSPSSKYKLATKRTETSFEMDEM